MLRLLQFLLFGHVHKWEELGRSKLTNDFGGVGTRFICRCEKCGKPRKFDLI